MRDIVQNSAASVMMLMVDSTSHVTGVTGLSILDAAITISKAGSAFATRGASTTTATDRGNGWYEVSLGTDDTNFLGDLVVHLAATGCDPADRLLSVVVADASTANATAATANTNITTMRTFYTDARAPKLDNLTGSVALDSTVAKASVLGTPMQTTSPVTLATSQPNYAPATAASLATLSGAVALDSTVAKASVLGTPMQTTTPVTLAASQPNYAPATAASLTSVTTTIGTINTNTAQTATRVTGNVALDATVAKSAAVAAIPTGTLLATDARLNYLDASVSSRLATGAPLTGGATAVWAYHNGAWVNVGAMVVFRPIA